MHRIFIVAGLLMSFVLHAEAQTPDSPADSSLQRLKWEVGTDMLWLLKKEPEESSQYQHFIRNPSPYVAILRIHQGNGSAYRIRLGGHYQRLLNPNTTLTGNSGRIEFNIITEQNLFFALGKEWEKRYSDFRFFYGSDAFVNYSFSSSERNIYNRNEFLSSSRKITAGLSPLVGVQYFVHPRLSFSTETHLNVAFHKYKSVALPGGDIDVPRGITKYNFFKASFLPFSTVNLNYHFN